MGETTTNWKKIKDGDTTQLDLRDLADPIKDAQVRWRGIERTEDIIHKNITPLSSSSPEAQDSVEENVAPPDSELPITISAYTYGPSSMTFSGTYPELPDTPDGVGNFFPTTFHYDLRVGLRLVETQDDPDKDYASYYLNFQASDSTADSVTRDIYGQVYTTSWDTEDGTIKRGDPGWEGLVEGNEIPLVRVSCPNSFGHATFDIYSMSLTLTVEGIIYQEEMEDTFYDNPNPDDIQVSGHKVRGEISFDNTAQYKTTEYLTDEPKWPWAPGLYKVRTAITADNWSAPPYPLTSEWDFTDDYSDEPARLTVESSQGFSGQYGIETTAQVNIHPHNPALTFDGQHYSYSGTLEDGELTTWQSIPLQSGAINEFSHSLESNISDYNIQPEAEYQIEYQTAEVANFNVYINKSASDLHVNKDEVIKVVTTIENTGGQRDTQDIKAVVAGSERARESNLTLDGGADEHVVLKFQAKETDDGKAVEVSSDDDSDTAILTVSTEANFTVDINESASDLDVGENQDINILATIKNTGEEQDTQNIEAIVDGAVRDTEENLTLDGGASEYINFSFQAQASDNGESVAIKSDDDIDRATLTVTSEIYFSVNINESLSDLDVEPGQDIKLVTTIENTGNVQGTQNIEAVIGSAIRATKENLTLDGGAYQDITLSFEAQENDDGQTVTVESDDDYDTAVLTVDYEPDYGDCVPFLTSDYANRDSEADTRAWRGYHFRVAEERVLTHLKGGAYQNVFRLALYESQAQTPTNILRAVDAPTERGGAVGIDPVKLVPGQDYIIAQGSTRDEPGDTAYIVDYWDILDMVTAENFLDHWYPAVENEDPHLCLYWGSEDSGGAGFGNESVILNTEPIEGSGTGTTRADGRPDLGFVHCPVEEEPPDTVLDLDDLEVYLDNIDSITHESAQLFGSFHATDSEVTVHQVDLYFEYTTDPDFQSDIETTETKTFYDVDDIVYWDSPATGLESGTKYYARPIAVVFQEES